MTPTPPDDGDIDWDVVPPPPTSAFDRLQTRTVRVAKTSASRVAPRGRTAWLVAGLVAILLVSAAASWWFSRGRDIPQDRDLLARFAETAEDVRPSYLTAATVQAEAYVADVFGWPIAVPALPDLSLVGVAEAPLSPQLSVPAFRYEGAGGEWAVVYAYDYVFLDQAGSLLDLPDATYARLAEPDPVDPRRLDDAYLVSWRRRSVLYTAVTESEAVFERLGRAVRESAGDAESSRGEPSAGDSTATSEAPPESP